MANDDDYRKAAAAVAAGQATPEQEKLNANMAKNSRAFSSLAQAAQDAYKNK